MDTFNLQRFIDAQEEPMFGWVLEELGAGLKKSHWMWFIFPQVNGLGESHNAKLYSIASLEEAKAYWDHEILGGRLRKCIELAIHSNKTALKLFGKEIDAIKFQSCLTLFLEIQPQNQLLKNALQYFYNNQLDRKTTAIIASLSKH